MFFLVEASAVRVTDSIALSVLVVCGGRHHGGIVVRGALLVAARIDSLLSLNIDVGSKRVNYVEGELLEEALVDLLGVFYLDQARFG